MADGEQGGAQKHSEKAEGHQATEYTEYTENIKLIGNLLPRPIRDGRSTLSTPLTAKKPQPSKNIPEPMAPLYRSQTAAGSQTRGRPHGHKGQEEGQETQEERGRHAAGQRDSSVPTRSGGSARRDRPGEAEWFERSHGGRGQLYPSIGRGLRAVGPAAAKEIEADGDDGNRSIGSGSSDRAFQSVDLFARLSEPGDGIITSNSN
jgi:hypothetical protein